jgi:hypothetical protein
MPVSNTDLFERIARVLAARAASANAAGGAPSAADTVDSTWQNYRDDALSIIRTLREPDQAMAEAGSAEIWDQMVEVAITRGEKAL